VHTQTAQIPTPSSPEIVYQKADVVKGATAALALVSRHGQITETTRHPAEPSVATNFVPSFPKIADAIAAVSCEYSVIRSLALDAHRNDRMDFSCHLNDSGILVFCRSGIEVESLV
jgi:hypothetical protein